MKINEYDYAPIGERIKIARLRLRYTQAELAELTGLAPKHISQLERGVCGLSVSTLIHICKALNTDADYILFGKITVSNNPINSMLQQLTPEQTMYAEEFLRLYFRSCGYKN